MEVVGGIASQAARDLATGTPLGPIIVVLFCIIVAQFLIFTRIIANKDRALIETMNKWRDATEATSRELFKAIGTLDDHIKAWREVISKPGTRR